MTDEELKSLVAENASSIASLAAAGKETDRRLKETERIVQENAIQMRETDRIVQENASQMRETDRRIDKVSKQIGGIDNNIGYHAEQFFQNVFAYNKVFGGIEYDEIVMNIKHNEEAEFDIFMRNGNSVALIEVKNRIRPDFVKKLAKERIRDFRKYFPEYKDYYVYLGIAGFSFDNAVLEEARLYGVGIVRQAGDGIEMDATGLRAYR